MAIYRSWYIDEQIKDYLQGFSAILIERAKAIGKTSSASKIANFTYNLDLKATQEQLRLSPEILLNQTKPILLDEWQHLPNIWNFVRHAIDDGLPDGSLIFAGS